MRIDASLKRAELLAEIRIAERRIASIRVHLASIESTIGAFAFAHTPAGRAERRQQAADPLRGRISRTILDVLRRACEALSQEEIVKRIAADRGIDGTDAALTNRVRDALAKRRDGLVTKQWRDGIAVWSV
jgi:hypothetical protein